MTLAVFGSTRPLGDDLQGTVLWRQDVVRYLAPNADAVRRVAQSVKCDLVVLDSDLPDAAHLVQALRQNPRTVSIVVLARPGTELVARALHVAGANAVLRLPTGPGWDERLLRLMAVPVRKEVRLPVDFEFEARGSSGVRLARGTALNLSVHGMLIASDAELSLDEIVDLRFRLPDPDTDVIGCGRIVRRAQPAAFGLEFFGLEGEGREAVQRYVESRAGSWNDLPV